MRKGALLKRAVEVGVDEDSLEEAEEADDTKAALIELIVVRSVAQLFWLHLAFFCITWHYLALCGFNDDLMAIC